MTCEQRHEKTNNLGFRPGPTLTGLYSHRNWLEASDFGLRKKMDCSNKSADQLCTTELCLCFHISRMFVFLFGGSNS